MTSAHVDEETLVLLAVGEPVPSSAAVETHLRDCDGCRHELSELRRVSALAREVEPADRRPPAPPPHVWDAVLRELDLDRSGAGAAAPSVAPAGPTTRGDGAGSDPAPSSSVPPTSLAGRRRTRGWTLAAAAVVTAIAVSVAVLLPGRADVVAETTLAALASDRTADARLVRSDDVLSLEIDAGDLDTVDGAYYEVWLADESVEGLVSLGPLTPGEPVSLPATLDPQDFPVVDVSVEPLDGNPAHSGDSLWRGQLPLG